jgi:predicted regulator of Ras-like GTPase activity (Roadblock/LC7/MglB family)
MIEILEPISSIPGVRMAGLVTSDGVPIVAPGASIDEPSTLNATVDIEAMSAIAVQYFDELSRLTGELTWDRPSSAVVRGARGTLMVRTIRGGVLLALLDSGVGVDQLKLPMDSAAMRIARLLSNMGGNARPMPERAPSASLNQPPAALPADGAETTETQGSESAANPHQARD